MKTKLAQDKQDARVMLKPHQQLQPRNYKVGIMLGSREIKTTSMTILDTSAAPYLINEKFVMTAWAPLLRTAKTSRIRSASNNPMKLNKVISQHHLVGQLHKTVGFLAVPRLAANIILYTAFISRSVDKISPNLKTITAVGSNAVAVVVAVEESLSWRSRVTVVGKSRLKTKKLEQNV